MFWISRTTKIIPQRNKFANFAKIVHNSPVLDLHAVSKSWESIAAVIAAAGDRIRWSQKNGNRKGNFSHCPTCRYSGKSGKIAIAEHNGKPFFYCHKCKTTGDAIGLQAGYTFGSTDTTNLTRQQWAILAAFFSATTATPPKPRKTISNRRRWAQTAIRRCELFAPEQSLILAYIASGAPQWDEHNFLDYACRQARAQKRDSLRKRLRKWTDNNLWQKVCGAGPDKERWQLLKKAAMRNNNGKFFMSAGARFLTICGYHAAARAAPSISALAGEAGVSVITAKRWWNYWVCAGIFDGQLFVPRRPARNPRQMKLAPPRQTPAKLARRREHNRLFSRTRLWQLWLAPLLKKTPSMRAIIRPPSLAPPQN